jgi:hypothetical protein
MSAGSQFWSLAPWSVYVLGWGAVLLALFKGEWEERTFAAGQVVLIVSDAVADFRAFGAHLGQEPLQDLANLALALFIALRSSKRWPIAAASLALAMVMTEAAQRLIHVQVSAYSIAQGVWEVLLDLVLAAGTIAAWRARRAKAAARG